MHSSSSSSFNSETSYHRCITWRASEETGVCRCSPRLHPSLCFCFLPFLVSSSFIHISSMVSFPFSVKGEHNLRLLLTFPSLQSEQDQKKNDFKLRRQRNKRRTRFCHPWKFHSWHLSPHLNALLFLFLSKTEVTCVYKTKKEFSHYFGIKWNTLATSPCKYSLNHDFQQLNVF